MVRRQLQLVYLRVPRCRDIQKGFAIRASAFRMLSPPQGRNGENRRSYPFDNVEHIVVGGLREQLGIEETIRNFIKCYNDERRRKMIEGGDKAARAATKRLRLNGSVSEPPARSLPVELQKGNRDAHADLRRRHVPTPQRKSMAARNAFPFQPQSELYRQRPMRLESGEHPFGKQTGRNGRLFGV
jgi:hypothetical protein